MFGWGFADFFAKSTIDRIDDLRTLFWSQLVGVVPLAVLLAVTHDVPTVHSWDPLWLVLFGIVSALSYLPVYTAFGKGVVSLLSPIFASYAVLVTLYSTVFFGEHIPAFAWAGIAVVVLGVLAISVDPGELTSVLRGRVPRATAGLPEITSALVVYSLWLVLLDHFFDGRDWIMFMLIIRSVSAATLFVYARVRHRPLGVQERSLWRYLVLIGLFDVGAFASVAYGFSHTSHTSVVAVISSAFSVPTLLLARAFLNERLSRSQLLAAGTIICGVVVLAAG